MKKEQKERLLVIREEMKKLIEVSDSEIRHSNADELLCEALEIYGEQELVELFGQVEKWYS